VGYVAEYDAALMVQQFKQGRFGTLAANVAEGPDDMALFPRGSSEFSRARSCGSSWASLFLDAIMIFLRRSRSSPLDRFFAIRASGRASRGWRSGGAWLCGFEWLSGWSHHYPYEESNP